jgi:hypothetical protein
LHNQQPIGAERGGGRGDQKQSESAGGEDGHHQVPIDPPEDMAKNKLDLRDHRLPLLSLVSIIYYSNTFENLNSYF